MDAGRSVVRAEIKSKNKPKEMIVAKLLGLRPKDKHVLDFMNRAMSLPLEGDEDRAASLVLQMSELYVWIEQKADDGVKGFLGQFMSGPFSNLLSEARNAGRAGKLPHTLLFSFLEVTRKQGSFENIDWLYKREKKK